jgi:hypothetical protein
MQPQPNGYLESIQKTHEQHDDRQPKPRTTDADVPEGTKLLVIDQK